MKHLDNLCLIAFGLFLAFAFIVIIMPTDNLNYFYWTLIITIICFIVFIISFLLLGDKDYYEENPKESKNIRIHNYGADPRWGTDYTKSEV